MSKAVDFLRSNPGGSVAGWKTDAQWRRDNWDWLKYSSLIAIRTRARMRTLNMTQKNLAERMGCSQQYVSLLLKGAENLTLETVAKLEKVLDFKLLSFANAPDAGTGYLSESERPVYGDTNPPSPSGE